MRKSAWALGLLSVLCASLNFSGAGAMAATPTYGLDAANRVITIHHVGNVTAEINSALTYLVNRPDKTTPWTVRFDGGTYPITTTLFSEKLQNVSFISNPFNPAILAKTPGFPTEYLFYTRFSKNISMSGFTIIGNTPTYIPANYVTGTSIGWQDQGVYFGSCNGVTISKNRFLNIGDAAIRVTTTERDPVPGVDSFNTQITQNYFDNIYQVTTTSNDTIHGGSAYLLMQDNTFDHIWGSVKFATRTSGATNVAFRNNRINYSATDGIEIVGYNNVEISNNSLQNITRNAVNCYTNSISTAGYEWGDNISFTNNVFNKVGNGIRLSADPYNDGFKPQLKNLTISGNSISNLTGATPALTLLKSSFPGLSITNNQFSGIPSRVYLYMPLKNTTALLSGNKLDTRAFSLF